MRSSLFWDVTQRGLVVTNVSRQPIDPIFKGQAVQEDGIDRSSCNVSNYQSTLCDSSEKQRGWLIEVIKWHGSYQPRVK